MMQRQGRFPKTYPIVLDKVAIGFDDGVTLVREDHGVAGSDFGGGSLTSRGIGGTSGYSKVTTAPRRLDFNGKRKRRALGGNPLRVIRKVTEP